MNNGIYLTIDQDLSYDMSFQKFETNSLCVGGRHHSATTNVVGDITLNKKTGKEIKLTFGPCFICSRKKSMTVSDNTIQAQSPSEFFKTLPKKDSMNKINGKNDLKNPRRGLEFTTNIATAAASKTPKTALSTLPELKAFYNTGICLCLGKLVCFYAI